MSLLASALRRDIAFGVLEPDARLRLDVLRGRYGGSNHSLREALRILSTEGLVEAEAQRGFRVCSSTGADLVDVLRLRLEIERLALGWSLERGGVNWEAAVVAAQHGLKRAEAALVVNPDDHNALAWDEALRAFHSALAAASNSPRLVTLQTQFYDQSRRFLLAALREGRLDFAARAQRLERLVGATLAGDRAAALDGLRDYVLGDFPEVKASVAEENR